MSVIIVDFRKHSSSFNSNENTFPMNWFNRLRLASKLGITFAAVLALTVLVGVFSIHQLAKVNDTSLRLSGHWMPGIRVIEDIKSQIARIRTRELQYIISSDQSEMDKYDKVIAQDLVDLKRMQDDYVQLLETPEEKQGYAEFLAMWRADNHIDTMVADWKAAIDSLVMLEDVRQHAIGWYGVSMGTAYGLPLAAAEPRIRLGNL